MTTFRKLSLAVALLVAAAGCRGTTAREQTGPAFVGGAVIGTKVVGSPGTTVGSGGRDLSTIGLIRGDAGAFVGPDFADWYEDLTGAEFQALYTVAGGAAVGGDIFNTGGGSFEYTLNASGALYTHTQRANYQTTIVRGTANSPFLLGWAGRIDSIGTNTDVAFVSLVVQSGAVIAATDAGCASYTALGIFPTNTSAFLTLKNWKTGGSGATYQTTTVPVELGIHRLYEWASDGLGTFYVLRDHAVVWTTTDATNFSGAPQVFFSFARNTGAPSAALTEAVDLIYAASPRI